MVVWELRRCVLPEPQDLSRWDLVEQTLEPGMLFAEIGAAKIAAEAMCESDSVGGEPFGEILWSQTTNTWCGAAGDVDEPSWFCQITPVEVR